MNLIKTFKLSFNTFQTLVGKHEKAFYFSTFLIFLSSIYEIGSLLLLIPYVEILQNGEILDASSKTGMIIKWVKDIFQFETNFELLIFTSVFISLVFFINFFIKYFSSKFSIKLTFKIAHDLSQRGYLNLVRRSFKFIKSENSSEYISLISSKTTQIVYGYFLSLYNLLNGIFMFGVLLIVILNIDLSTGLSIFLSLILIFGVLLKLKGKKVFNRGTKISEKNSQIIKFIQESRGFIRQIFLYKLGDFFVTKFKRLDKESKELQFQNQWQGTYPKFFVESSVLTIIPLLIIVSVTLSSQDASSQETLASTSLKLFVFLIVSIQRLLPVVNQMYVGIIAIRGTQGSINDYLRLVKSINSDEAPKNKVVEIPFNEKIYFKNIFFQYAEQHQIFKDLNFELYKSEKVALIGKSGSGKSTFIDLLSGLNIPTHGKIQIDKTPLTNLNRDAWSSKITYIPQEDFFLDESVMENILLGSNLEQFDFERLKWACKIALVDEFLEISKSGLELFMGENGNKFSGGQKQRIGIARALYRKSELLIFDESTSSLDSQIEQKIIRKILKNLGSETIIFVTHRLSVLKNFDKVYKVEKDKIRLEKNGI
jgi:ATP-binding cassette subfamily B protein